MDARQHWKSQLDSPSVDDQLSSLRKVAVAEEVQGLTETIVRLAGSPDDEVRMWAAEALERSVDPSIDEAQPLIDILESSPDGEVQYWASTMLGRLGGRMAVDSELAGSAAAALDSCLQVSRYLPARERAVWALCQIGPAAKSAIPTLLQTLTDSPARLQRLSADALKMLDVTAA